MNKLQARYAIAKATVETITAERNATMAQYKHLLDSDATIEQYVDLEMALENELGYEVARTTLQSAEIAMVEWALSIVPDMPEYRPLRNDGWRKSTLTIKYRMIDLAFKLSL